MRSGRLRTLSFLALCCGLGLSAKKRLSPAASLVTDALTRAETGAPGPAYLLREGDGSLRPAVFGDESSRRSVSGAASRHME